MGDKSNNQHLISVDVMPLQLLGKTLSDINENILFPKILL